jgi:CHASE1-domain containing sensor protein
MKFRTEKSSDDRMNQSRVFGAVPVLIAGIISTVVSVVAWRLTAASEDRAFALEYTQHADNQATLLQNGIASYLDKLYAVRAFFDSSDHAISRDEFENFGRALLEKNPAILNIAWIARVKRDERAAHEQAAARDGHTIHFLCRRNGTSTFPNSIQRKREHLALMEWTSVVNAVVSWHWLTFGMRIRCRFLRH